MRKYIGLLFAAVALSGCTGVVIGSVPTHGNWPQPTADARPLPPYSLPIAYFSLTIDRKEDGGVCKLTVTLGDTPVMVPDRRASFGLNLHHHWYTSDHFSVETDGQGLLASINGQSQDELLAIAVQSITTVGDIIKFAGAMPFNLVKGRAPNSPKPPALPPCVEFNATFLFDPQNPSDLARANSLLETTLVHIDPLRVAGEPDVGEAIAPAGATPATACEIVLSDGPGKDRTLGNGEMPCIFFRMAKTYRMTVRDQRHAAGASDKAYDFLLTAPDTGSIYAIEMNRRPLVKFDTKLTFAHGVFTGYEFDDPSQGLAIVKLPSDIINAILPLFPQDK